MANMPRLPCGPSPRGPRCEAVEQQSRVLLYDPFDAGRRLLAVPGGDGAAHAQDAESDEAGVEVRAELAIVDADLHHLLDDALIGTRPAADPAPALSRQVLPFVLEDTDEIAFVE